MRRLLCVDPVKRITLSELLLHPWLKVSVDRFTRKRYYPCAGRHILIDHMLFVLAHNIGVIWSGRVGLGQGSG